MAKKRVPIYSNPRQFVDVDPEATKGAQLGVNLVTSDGRVLTEADVLNPAAASGNNNQRTIWRFIQEIPANIKAVAALAGQGLATRKADGEWALRTIQSGEGIDVEDGDGDAGDPTIALVDLPDSGAGSLLAITRDEKGRVSGTREATITGTAQQIDVQNGTAAAGQPTLSLAPEVAASLEHADSALQEIQPGTGISIDNSDPRRPIVTATGGGGGGAVSSVNARTGDVAVPDYATSATPPTSEDYGRALVNGDRWRDSSNGKLYTYQGGAWLDDSGGGGGSATRQSTNLASGLGVASTGKTALLLRVVATAAARIRFYSTAAARTADAARSASVAAPQGAGLLLEFIAVDALLGAPLTPGVIAYNLDSPVVGDIYYNIQPVGGSMTVALTYLPLES